MSNQGRKPRWKCLEKGNYKSTHPVSIKVLKITSHRKFHILKFNPRSPPAKPSKDLRRSKMGYSRKVETNPYGQIFNFPGPLNEDAQRTFRWQVTALRPYLNLHQSSPRSLVYFKFTRTSITNQRPKALCFSKHFWCSKILGQI